MPATFLGVVPFGTFLGIAQVFLVYGFLVLLVVGSYRYVTLRRAFDERIHLEKADRVNSTIERLRAKLDLRDLFVLNRQQLDEYHVASVRQQSIAFRNAQIAAAIGFLTLLAGVVISLQGTFQRGSGDGLALGLTALASLLSGFIAAVFFRSAESTGKQLREFYKEPYRTAQVLAIERLAALESQYGNKGSNDHESMDVEARQQLRQTIVEGLLHIQRPDPEDKPDVVKTNVVKTKDTKGAETSYLPVLGLGFVDLRDPHAVIRHKGVSAGTSTNLRH
jgi:hypothetical protein